MKNNSPISLTIIPTEKTSSQVSLPVSRTLPGGISSTAPTAQQVVDQQIMMRCGVARQFPNPQMSTYIGDRIARMIGLKKRKLEPRLQAASFIGQIDDAIWSAMGIAVKVALGGILGKAVATGIAFLASKSTAAVDEWISELQYGLDNAIITPETINKLAFIGGDPSMMQTIKDSVSQIPSNQLNSELYRLIQEERKIKNDIIPIIPSYIFDRSPLLQLQLYFALATTQITIKYVCDALMGTDEPLVATVAPLPVDSAPPGSKIPSYSSQAVKGDGTQKKGLLVPILIALGIGAYSLI